MTEKKITELLAKKRAFFEVILELSETESSLFLPEYLSVLEQKKILLSCIEEIDHKLSAFKESLFVISQEISDELDTIKGLVEEILHIDNKNQLQRKEELKKVYKKP